MRTVIRNIGLGVLILLFTALAAWPASVAADQSAASQSALSVSPAIIEDVTPAGAPKKITIKVSNITNFPLPISGTVKNLVPSEQIEDSAAKSKYDASQWFSITDPDFILQPKQTRTVMVTITPPAGAEPGGHYATIYFTPLIPETALTPSTAYLSAQVGTLAFLIVPGQLTEKLSIAALDAPTISQSRSVNFDVKLKNSGNVHLSPNGTVIVKNWRGHQVANLRLRPGIVLPGTEKTVSVSWHASSPIGKYTATAQVTYGSNNTKTTPVTATLWIIPWGWLLGLGLPLIIVVALALRYRGRWVSAWRILRGKS